MTRGMSSPCANECTNEGTDTKQGDDKTCPDVGEVTCRGNCPVSALAETLKEVVHQQDIGNLAGIILERESQDAVV